MAAAASTIIGVTFGLIAGYLGGVADKIISWVIDFFLSLPILLLVLAIVPIMQKSLASSGDLTADETSRIRFFVLIVILFVFGWMGLARLVRGEVKSLREREFVQAARAIGVPTRSILFREILPNLVGPIIVSASIAVPAYITYEATLSYLGAGLVEPTASWGRTIADAQNLFSTYPLWLWPSSSACRCSCWPSACSATRSATRSTPPAAADPTGSRSPDVPGKTAGTSTREQTTYALDQSPDRGSRGFPRLRRCLWCTGRQQRHARWHQRQRRQGRPGRCGPRPERQGPRPEIPGAKKGGILTVPYSSTPPTWTRATSSTRTRPSSSR